MLHNVDPSLIQIEASISSFAYDVRENFTRVKEALDSVAEPSPVSAAVAKTPPPVEQIAHRCFASMAPQSTLVALEYCLQRGYRSIESDVTVIADGTPVMLHDNDVANLTTGSGLATDMTLPAVKALDIGAKWLNGSFAGTRIATLKEFLSAAKGRMDWFYPEIKNYRSISDINLILQGITEAGVEDITYVASFRIADLRYVRDTAGNDRVGLLYTANSVTQGDINTAMALGGRVAFSLSYDGITANPACVAQIRAAGSDVAAWTVPNIFEAERLKALGVTRIISDRPILEPSNP